MNSKFKKVAAVSLAVILTAGIGSSIALSASMMKSVNSLNTQLNHYIAENEDVPQENGVKIENQYTIKATTQISDAYKSGDRSKLSDKDKETLDMASAVLKKIIKKSMTAYQKELEIYKWMTTKLQSDSGVLSVIPDTQQDSDNPYGVLKFHNAICVGYATTFRLFMQMMNIECKVCHSSDRTHSWDMVKLGGDWYHTDIYMDSGSCTYQNFNMNDSVCHESHDWNTDYFPQADGIKYNYAYQNKSEIKDIYEIPTQVKKAISDKKTVLCLTFKSGITSHLSKIAECIIQNLNSRFQSEEKYADFTLSSTWMQIGANEYLLSIAIDGYPSKNENTDKITDKDADKAESSINKAFGKNSDWTFENYTDESDMNTDEAAVG